MYENELIQIAVEFGKIFLIETPMVDAGMCRNIEK